MVRISTRRMPEAYIAELAALDAEGSGREVAALPEAALVITSHHMPSRYFTSAYGLAFDAPVGTTTEARGHRARCRKVDRHDSGE